jgi:hypothetical protein
MTLESNVAGLIWTAFSVAALWAMHRYLLVPALRDSLRQQLFAIRRELFVYMASGNIDPDNVAYGRVRTFMNSAIRYANDLSLTRALIGVAVAGQFGRERVRELERSIAALPAPAQVAISAFRKRAADAIGRYMIARSPVGWLLVALFVPVALAVSLLSLLQRAWSKPWSDALAIFSRRAEQETQILRCMEEDGAAAAA